MKPIVLKIGVDAVMWTSWLFPGDVSVMWMSWLLKHLYFVFFVIFVICVHGSFVVISLAVDSCIKDLRDPASA